MKILALSLLIIITYLFTVLDIQAREIKSICGCHPIPMNLSGVVDESAPVAYSKAWYTLIANQEL